MFGLLIGALVVGGIAKAAGGAISREAERKNNIETAIYNMEKLRLQTDTMLGSMQREMTLNMEGDYEQYGDIDTAMRGRAGLQAQQTYMGQLGQENEYMGTIASNERAMGELESQQAAGGTKEDVNLQAVINSELQANANAQRTQIDKSLGLSVHQMKLETDQAKTAIGRIEGKYEENSAMMNLYNYKRNRIQEQTAFEMNYLQKAIRDNQYTGNWVLADIFGGITAATDTITQIYSLGLGK